jgi:hypothetical protein
MIAVAFSISVSPSGNEERDLYQKWKRGSKYPRKCQRTNNGEI